MTDWVRQVLERYGQDVTVDTADGERTVRAFLQPMTERDERARSDVTSIGWVDGRLWLYLGQTALEEGEALAWEPRASGCAAAGPTTLVTRCPTTGRRWNRSGRRRNAGAESDPGCSGLRPGGGGGCVLCPGPARRVLLPRQRNRGSSWRARPPARPALRRPPRKPARALRRRLRPANPPGMRPATPPRTIPPVRNP